MSGLRGLCHLVFWKDLELFTCPIVTGASQIRMLHKPSPLVPVCISSAAVLGVWGRGGNT